MHDSSPSREGAGDPLPQSHPEALRRFTSHVYKKSFPPLSKQQQTLSYWAFLKEQRESRRGGEGPQFRVTSLEDLWTKGVTKARGGKASEKGNKYIYMIIFFKLACLAWLVGWAQINLFAKLPYSWIWEFLLFYMMCLQQRIHSYDEFSFPLMQTKGDLTYITVEIISHVQFWIYFDCSAHASFIGVCLWRAQLSCESFSRKTSLCQTRKDNGSPRTHSLE